MPVIYCYKAYFTMIIHHNFYEGVSSNKVYILVNGYENSLIIKDKKNFFFFIIKGVL